MFDDLEYYLECGHLITRPEIPDTPGADLPRVGRVVWCPECNAQREITAIEPECWTVWSSEEDGIDAGCIGASASASARGYRAGEGVAVLYNAKYGEWGWFPFGVSQDGNAYSGQDEFGFASFDEAKEAALEFLEEV
ncbi:MAG: hypothetical protein JRJ79_18055 [Deltaproteobacteria bacterium]|nr:hypothetical protein [Deltaproteobacteria bacterium]